MKFADVYLGDLDVFERSDWKNESREPEEKDFRVIRVHAAASLVHAALERNPVISHPAEPEIPWPMIVIREACRASEGVRSPSFEEEVTGFYVSKYGMNQLVQIWGGDVGPLLESMERAMADEG